MSYELGTTASSGYFNPITTSPAVSSSSGGFYNPSSSSYRIRSNHETDAVAGLIVILCELCCMCCANWAKEEDT